jgi:hypothetical protein
VQRYNNNVQTQFGAPASYASVAVVLHGTSTAATLYSTNGPNPTPLTNPVTCDVNGNFGFYVADGHYDLVITGANLTAFTLSDILINDSSYGPDNVGSTANRPNPPTLNQEYMDTTLGQPIWCEQVSPPIWLNAAGVQV